VNTGGRFHRPPHGERGRTIRGRRGVRSLLHLSMNFAAGFRELTVSAPVALRHSSHTVSMNILVFLVVSFWCFPAVMPYADAQENVITVFTYADSVFSSEQYPMAKPLKGGPLRVLLFGDHRSAGRMSAGIAARLDCRLSAVFTRNRRTLRSSAPGEGKGMAPGDSLIVRRLAGLLAGEWDVFLLDFEIESLPPVLRDALMKDVERGTGLVYAGDGGDIRPFVTKKRLDGRALEVLSYGGMKAKAVGRREKGIMVCMPPLPGEERIHGMCDYFSCAVNALIFASPRPKETRVVKVHAPRKIEYESMHFVNLRLDLYRAGETRPMDVCCRYRDDAGKLVHESVDRFNIRKGKSFINLDYPVLPAGRYSLDISISDEDGVAALAGTSFVVVAAQSIRDVRLWSSVSEEGGVIAGTVRFSEKFKEGMRLHAELRDSRGRLYDSSELEVIPGRYTSRFSFLAGETRSRVMTVGIHFLKGGEPVQTVVKRVYLRKPRDSRVFSLMVGGAGMGPLHDADRLGFLRDAGVAAFVLDVPVAEGGRSAFEKVLETSTYMPEVIPFFRCADVEDERVRAVVDTLRPLGLPGYIVRLGAHRRHRGSFVEYLEKKYGTVESLNEAWGTRFTSFGQASPVSSEERGAGASYPRRLDSILYEEHAACDLRRDIRGCIASLDSTARVGVIGFPPVSAGDSIVRVNAAEPSLAESGAGLNPEFENILVLRGNGEGVMVLRRLGGGMLNRSGEPFVRYVPWRSLFAGMNGIWWDIESGWMDSPLTPTGNPSPAFSALAGEVAEITEGIDRLLSGCSERPGRVAVLYSPLSILAAGTTDARGGAGGNSFNPAVESLRAFCLLCRDTGYTPVFVTEEQVSAGLSGRDYTALVLPFVRPLSDELSDGLKAFVKGGGRLVADVGAGVVDENLVPRKGGALDDVFGIVQSAGDVPLRDGGVFEPLDTGEIRMTEMSAIPGCSFDGALGLRGDGRVFRAASVDGVPAMVVNEYGEGRAVFYNLAMWAYPKFRDGETGNRLRNLFLSSMCLLSGTEEVEPYAVLRGGGGENVSEAVVYTFRDGDAAYIGVLPDPSMKTDGESGAATLEISGGGDRKAVYDVRNGVFLGMVEKIPVSLEPGGARLFALLPYRVRELEVSVDKPVVKTGDELGYSVTVVPHEPGAEPGRHVFRVSVIGPDGRERPGFAGSFDGACGTFQGKLRIALDDTPGRWMLQVSDTATGKRGERTFMVMARSGTARFPR